MQRRDAIKIITFGTGLVLTDPFKTLKLMGQDNKPGSKIMFGDGNDRKRQGPPAVPANQTEMHRTTRQKLDAFVDFGLSKLKVTDACIALGISFVDERDNPINPGRVTAVGIGKAEKTAAIYDENGSKMILNKPGERYNVSYIYVDASAPANITVYIRDNPWVKSIYASGGESGGDGVSREMYRSDINDLELIISKNGENYAVTFYHSGDKTKLLDTHFLFSSDNSYFAIKQLYDGSVAKAMKFINE